MWKDMLLEMMHFAADTAVDVKSLPKVAANRTTLQTLLTIVFVVTGAISLLVITLAGARYIISRGEPNEVAKAKRAIMYAIAGLIVSISAGTIVNFVIGSL